MRLSAIFQLFVVCALGLTPCFADESAPTDPLPTLSAGELDSLTAPIALYPDALVAQILTASTYPLEVVEAAHWLENPSNAALRGDALAAALEHENWDLSVKSLVPFPDTLRMMERNLQWTEQIGDAFLAQQNDVMDSIQRLRKLAISAGTLKSTPEQTVWNQDDQIVVEPVAPDVVYVPYYNPTVVYGTWPWAEYAPFVFPPPPGIYLGGRTIVFGVGFAVIRPLWGWSYWNWPRHSLFIPPHLPHTWPLRPGPWRHDPDHRRGLPYRDHRPLHPYSPGPLLRPRIPPSGLPRHDAHPPGQPQIEHRPGRVPPPNRPRPGTQPPAHRPAPPPPNRGQLTGDDRSRQRPPAVHPHIPSGPPTTRSTGPRTEPPKLGAPRGGRADPSRNPTPPDRSAAGRGREPPRKPQ